MPVYRRTTMQFSAHAAKICLLSVPKFVRPVFIGSTSTPSCRSLESHVSSCFPVTSSFEDGTQFLLFVTRLPSNTSPNSVPSGTFSPLSAGPRHLRHRANAQTMLVSPPHTAGSSNADCVHVVELSDFPAWLESPLRSSVSLSCASSAVLLVSARVQRAT